MSRVTMKDIAGVVGVSVMTVSNAFNRPDQLSPELRERILRRADKMGYGGPNVTARNLRSGRTHSYGVVLPDSLSYAFKDPFTALWLSGLSLPLEIAGASVTLLSMPSDDDAHLDVVRKVSVDGFAALCALPAVMTVAGQRGLPWVSTEPDGGDSSWVAIDDYEAGRQIGAHIARLGHRRVSIVVERWFPRSRPEPTEEALDIVHETLDDYERQGFAWSRVRGIVAGLADVRPSVVTPGGNSRESGFRAGELLLDRHQRPTAIIALSDVLALGVMDAMARRGVVAGRDVSVSGFDDIPDAERSGLTTVRQPILDKGRLAGELLLDPARQPRQIMLPHELIVRASTGPAPGT